MFTKVLIFSLMKYVGIKSISQDLVCNFITKFLTSVSPYSEKSVRGWVMLFDGGIYLSNWPRLLWIFCIFPIKKFTNLSASSLSFFASSSGFTFFIPVRQATSLCRFYCLHGIYELETWCTHFWISIVIHCKLNIQIDMPSSVDLLYTFARFCLCFSFFFIVHVVYCCTKVSYL